MKRGLLGSAALALGLLSPPAFAQPSGLRRGPDLSARSGLGIGDPLPELTGHDAAGKPFPLRSLKGSYTVLVFGCLT